MSGHSAVPPPTFCGTEWLALPASVFVAKPSTHPLVGRATCHFFQSKTTTVLLLENDIDAGDDDNGL